MRRRNLLVATAGMVLWLSAVCPVAADISDEEAAALYAAVEHIAPAVVQIETVGRLERVQGVLFGTGPTTGLIVDPDGYLISSAFNFVNQPASILVRLPDGTRKPAKLAATDHARMLVLLKIDAKFPWPLWEAAPREELRVGQWAVAVGRTFDAATPNMAVGIISALDRVWGKAVQTDAAVSPNNYGGPLLDIRGRVIGVLAPLSPQAANEVAGIEWYDSGIGFAVPMDYILRVLPRLKQGEDLYAGVAGINFKGPPITSPPVIASCHPRSPATEAKLKPGDLIVEIEGKPIARAADVRYEIGRRIAGDKMRMVVLRGQDRIECELRLAAKLEPFIHGFLGVLPMRDAGEGVGVRYVYPQSPAASAGIQAGDVLLALNGETLKDRDQWTEKLSELGAGSEVQISILRGKEKQDLRLVLAELPDGLPPKELPPAVKKSEKPPGAALPQLGVLALKVPEYPNETLAYVPENYEPSVPHGVVFYLHPAGGYEWDDLLSRWKALCNQYGFILVAPKSADPARWTPNEIALAGRLLAAISATYNVDRLRVATYGYEQGGQVALAAAFHAREAIRGAAAVEAALPTPPPENEPQYRLAIYLAVADKSPMKAAVERAAQAVRQKKIPLVLKHTGEAPRQLNAEELADLARWIDALDRF